MSHQSLSKLIKLNQRTKTIIQKILNHNGETLNHKQTQETCFSNKITKLKTINRPKENYFLLMTVHQIIQELKGILLAMFNSQPKK